MQVDIVPSGTLNLEMMRDLGELSDELQEAGLAANRAGATLPGTKDGGLTVAIALAGLAFSSISSLISVLSYWSSRKPSYTLTLEAGSKQLTISQLDKAGVQSALRELESIDSSSQVLIRVARA